MMQYRDTFELEDIFDREEAQRRRVLADTVRARAAEIDAEETAKQAIAKARSTEFTLRNRNDVLCEQYRAAGVEPVHVNSEGVPTVSLTLILSIGWTIQEVDGEKRLFLPSAPPAREPR
jgi:hypothetical protein